ncbi:MAG: CRTAC1 family protein [Myxococcales bacterium]|nr:CRTAC1 family protein [Myxococcales bacterium]
MIAQPPSSTPVWKEPTVSVQRIIYRTIRSLPISRPTLDRSRESVAQQTRAWRPTQQARDRRSGTWCRTWAIEYSLAFAVCLSACGVGSTGNSSQPAADSLDSSAIADAAASADIAADSSAGPDAADSSTHVDASKPLCPTTTVQSLGEGFFVDISVASGIRAANVVYGSATAVPINDHSRLGFIDLDGDGKDDIVSHSLYPNPQAGIPFEHLIFRNKGDGTFEHFSDASGLRYVPAGWFAFGDVDNDGDEDCLAGLDVQLPGKTHQILLNDGQGHFAPKSASGVEKLPAVAGNAVFADFNGDANLDLFIGMGHTSYAVANVLLIGNGDGTFVAHSDWLGFNPAQPTNGTVACDYDNDGDMDVIVSNYGVSILGGHNALYNNDGTAHFTEVAESVGFAYQKTGNSWLEKSGMVSGDEPNPTAVGYIGNNGFGLDCGDFNGDGRLDVLLSAISHPVASDYNRKWSDPTQLLINTVKDGKIVFVSEGGARKLPFNEGDVDAGLVDFDNDGRLDASLSRDKKYEGGYTGIDQKAWFGLLHQQPDGSLASVGPVSGINALNSKPSASHAACVQDSECLTNGEKCLAKACRTPCATDLQCTVKTENCASGGYCKDLLGMKNAQNHGWSDIDGDGDLDLLVGGRDTGGGRPNFLFRNDVGSKLPWLQLRLLGDGIKVNRSAIGARVTLAFASGTVQTREVKASRGMHDSMDGRTLHFGLGQLGCEFVLKVRWPDGTVATLDAAKVAPNKALVVSYPDLVQ